MVVCNRIIDIPKIDRSALTIGSFDGIHCGHLEILKKVRILSSGDNSVSVVVTFDPHPKSILKSGSLDEKYLITTLEKKIEIFEAHGIDYVLILPFDENLANIEADFFLEEIIVKYFNPHDIVVGYDHHFGYNRVGDIDLLKSYSQAYSYGVHKIDQIENDGIPISSSKIRIALASDQINKANQFLGWSYEIKGIVEKGDGIGRTIGFPTANVGVLDAHQIIPSNGVYRVDVKIEGKIFGGMCNIGNRPTVGGTGSRIEVNIFLSESLDLYSKEITLIFREYLRNEKNFSSMDELKAQLKIDKKHCLEIN
mgnify:CR=1 FL=1|tara:strand:+ start:25604 stop:26533 length:930 start_codon:yes stop_codon:yes gene_type:complete